ncbi:MAG: M20 family metallopeptidase [Flavobacteriia bacterium]|jgi:amidohydrolase
MDLQLQQLIKEKAKSIFEKVRSFREHLHRYPELSYLEYNTMKYVSNILTEHNIQHEIEIGKTGVVALIKSEKHSNDVCIGLRADLDALPIQEENDVPYKSEVNGVMHACGHDVHTSILLGAAIILNELKDQLPYSVKCIFQPGEEKNPGGATYMIADGVLENPKVKELYALHVFPSMQVGNVGFKEGIYMASCDEIHLTIHGKGGHGATPNECIDPIIIGSSIVLELQQIVSRKCDPKIPSVLSFGHFEALGATNIIPSKAILKGTFRTMNESWRAQALALIESNIRSIAEMQGASVDLEISKGYPYLENDPVITSKLRKKAIDFLGADNVEELPIRLTSEDFSFYSHKVPVCFFRLGVRNESKGITFGVHHPRFDIDTDALLRGVEMMCLAVL